MLTWQNRSIKSSLEEEIRLKEQIKIFYSQCQESNVENNRTILALEKANFALADSVRVSEEERIEAVRDAVEREARARAELDDTLEELDELRDADPTCAEFASVDFAAACPAVVDRLREFAAGPADSQD